MRIEQAAPEFMVPANRLMAARRKDEITRGGQCSLETISRSTFLRTQRPTVSYLNNFARTAQSSASSNFRGAMVRSGLLGSGVDKTSR